METDMEEKETHVLKDTPILFALRHVDSIGHKTEKYAS